MEERQLSQLLKLFLPIDLIIVIAKLLKRARENSGEFLAVLVAFLRVLLQTLGHDLLKNFGHVVTQRVDRRRRRIHDLVQQLRKIVGAKRTLAGKQFVHDRAERIEVGTMRDFRRLHLLRGHVAWRAGNAAYLRVIGVCVDRDTKVDDAHVRVVREHDVAGLDVPMHDAAVRRVVQRLGAP